MELKKTSYLFQTKEKKTTFHICLEDCIELSREALDEITTRGLRYPNDDVILKKNFTFDIKLGDTEKEAIKNELKKILSEGLIKCLEEKTLILSKHILRDYLLLDPAELQKRGFSPELKDLSEEIYYTLIECHDVLKAQLTFKYNRKSEPRMSYTVIGTHKGKQRSLSFSFLPKVSGESVIAATIRDIN